MIKRFPIVCVGGSAGGLDAYIRLLKHLPADMGVAIVIVNHITIMPTQLHEVLPRYTTMPVDLIPANRDLHVSKGVFLLKPISKPRGWPDVITLSRRTPNKLANSSCVMASLLPCRRSSTFRSQRHSCRKRA